MRTRLNQITLSQLIEVYCGKGDALKEDGEKPSALELEKARLEVLLEYRKVVDYAGYKRAINRQKGDIVFKAKVEIFKMCIMLVCLGGYSNVRKVYDEMKIKHDKLNDEQLASDVKRRLNAALFDYKRHLGEIEQYLSRNEVASAEERRDAMIDDTSFVMTHYKFQIDPDRLNARAYATMRRSMMKELEAKKRALNSLKNAHR